MKNGYFISKLLVCVLAAVCMLFFTGCGPKEKEDDKGNLPEVPNVGGNDGKLDERNNEGAGGDPLWENKLVTAQNLDEFEREFVAAMTGGAESGAAATREMKTENKRDSIPGKHGYKIEESRLETMDGTTGKLTFVYKYFNFSENERIFFGGAAAMALYVDENNEEGELTGEIKFNGLFKGSVVYKNRKIDGSGTVVVKSGGNEFNFKAHTEEVFSMSLGF